MTGPMSGIGGLELRDAALLLLLSEFFRTDLGALFDTDEVLYAFSWTCLVASDTALDEGTPSPLGTTPALAAKSAAVIDLREGVPVEGSSGLETQFAVANLPSDIEMPPLSDCLFLLVEAFTLPRPVVLSESDRRIPVDASPETTIAEARLLVPAFGATRVADVPISLPATDGVFFFFFFLGDSAETMCKLDWVKVWAMDCPADMTLNRA